MSGSGVKRQEVGEVGSHPGGEDAAGGRRDPPTARRRARGRSTSSDRSRPRSAVCRGYAAAPRPPAPPRTAVRASRRCGPAPSRRAAAAGSARRSPGRCGPDRRQRHAASAARPSSVEMRRAMSSTLRRNAADGPGSSLNARGRPGQGPPIGWPGENPRPRLGRARARHHPRPALRGGRARDLRRSRQRRHRRRRAVVALDPLDPAAVKEFADDERDRPRRDRPRGSARRRCRRPAARARHPRLRSRRGRRAARGLEVVRQAGHGCRGRADRPRGARARPPRSAAALDEFGAPHVVKADGLAAGKGVIVTDDREAALAHADAYLATGPCSSRSSSTGPRCRSSSSATATTCCR